MNFLNILLLLFTAKRCESGSNSNYEKDDNFCSKTNFNEIATTGFDFNKRQESEKACRAHNWDFSFHNSYSRLLMIKGGNSVEVPKFPHMVALAFNIPGTEVCRFKCGGSLISPRYVLTAAHCLQNPAQEEVAFVRLGSLQVPQIVEEIDPLLDIRVKSFIVHECFRRLKKLNDIALIELDRSVQFSKNIRPICLYSSDEEPEEMVATGWGVTGFRGLQSFVLQEVSLSPTPSGECEQLYKSKFNINIMNTHICAGDDTKNTCEGDSGGPLQVKYFGTWYIVGVTASGEMCGARAPGIYTRVSSYLSWIEDKVWPRNV